MSALIAEISNCGDTCVDIVFDSADSDFVASLFCGHRLAVNFLALKFNAWFSMRTID